MGRTDAKKIGTQKIGMNSGYLQYVYENDTWYHVPEEKWNDFGDLVEDIKNGGDEDFDEFVNELEEDFDKYKVDLNGVRCVLFIPE